MNDYFNLKSGTDIRGVAIGSEQKPVTLTEKAVADLAGAFALWLTRRTSKPRCKIAVCHDSRLTGEGFKNVILDALKFCSLELFDCGLFSTPAAFMTTKLPSMSCDGAIMITASHHPRDINGLKFFTAEGGVNGAELSKIIELANCGERIAHGSKSMVLRRDYLRLYCDNISEIIRKGTGLFRPLNGMKIVVDAGHGAAGFFASRVLEPLGADVSGSQFLEPDGNFPAHAPNPENAEAMDSLKNRVIETGADLGVIFDADGDRCAVVTRDGTEVNRCRLIALAAAMILPEHNGATIVTDSVTTEGLKKFIASKGGVQKRFKRGYRNVIDEAKRLCELGVDAPLAIESSGHVAFAEHYFLDDGAYFVAKILITFSKLYRDGKDLIELISGLETPKEELDFRLDFVNENWRDTAKTVLERLTGLSERLLKISDDNNEGVRAYVSHADGYFIVRTSVHDPVLPIYIESNKTGGALSIAGFLYSFLCEFRGLDCTPLYDYIEQNTSDDEAAEIDQDDYSEQGEYVEQGEYAEQDEYYEQSEYAEQEGSEQVYTDENPEYSEEFPDPDEIQEENPLKGDNHD